MILETYEERRPVVCKSCYGEGRHLLKFFGCKEDEEEDGTCPM